MTSFATRLRDPLFAACVAACITGVWVYVHSAKAPDQPLKSSVYMRPAALVGILVYAIISLGIGAKEEISNDKF